jgi:hypothetical protein
MFETREGFLSATSDSGEAAVHCAVEGVPPWPASDAGPLKPQKAPSEDRLGRFNDQRARASRLRALSAAPATDMSSASRCSPEGVARSTEVLSPD